MMHLSHRMLSLQQSQLFDSFDYILNSIIPDFTQLLQIVNIQLCIVIVEMSVDNVQIL